MSTALCSSSKHNLHTQVSLRKPLRCGFTILLCSCLLFGATHCRAQETQDVAKAAREERARREQAKNSKHVYTDEDLARTKILTPEDEERFAADRKGSIDPSPADGQTPASLDASLDLPQLPLGDIARRYRDAKRAMQAPTAFHLPFDEPAFASPIAPVSEPAPPRPSFSPAHPNLLPAQPRAVVAPAMPSPAPLHRVDPFARRSAPAEPSVARVAPTAPASRPSVSHPAPAPALPQPSVSANVAAPRLGSPKFAPVPAAPVTHPSVPRVAPAPEVRQPNLSKGITAPKLASREFEPPKFAPTPAAPTGVAPEIAPLTAVGITPPAVHTVTVQPGDSLWKLAQQNLGRGSRWQELLAANPSVVDPTHLAAGTQIVVPTETPTLKHVKSDTKIAVQKGDTLSAIARANYGRAEAWRCIAQANPQIVDANRIYEGQQLLLPFKCKP
jgi:nucleoid-associated protein YgaU